jgi:hypothetical protein
MPLFGRRLFHFNQDDYKENHEQIYTIEHTGEIFYNQILYDKLKKVYALERWTCECTWRAGLTHQEAYQSENEIRSSLLSIVPTYFHPPIFDIIYHSKTNFTEEIPKQMIAFLGVKPLEKLAEEVSIILGYD